MKKCSKCGIEKDLSFYNKRLKSIDGLRPDCKDCRKLETTRYRNLNKDKLKAVGKIYYEKNKVKRQEYHNEWREKNRDKLREYSKQLYRKDLNLNREKRRIYVNKKMNTDFMYKLRSCIRTRLFIIFKTKNINKKDTTLNILGCNFDTAKKHIENQFNNGMSWDNYGKWHIDHIIPLYSAKSEKELIELCNYKNLQPLWAKDNLSKGKKIY